MAARHNFRAAQVRKAIETAASEGALEVMVQTQTEMQQMVSQPGRGRVYAKGSAGARRLDPFMSVTIGSTGKQLAAMKNLMDNPIIIEKQRKGKLEKVRRKKKFSVVDAIGKDAAKARMEARKYHAMRHGVKLNDAQIAQILKGKGKKSFANLGEAGLHRASAPGQPPTVRTGRLRRSIQMARPQRMQRGSLKGWRITLRLLYAPYLEDGTTQMEARPFVKPTLNLMRGRANGIIADRIRAAGFGVS